MTVFLVDSEVTVRGGDVFLACFDEDGRRLESIRVDDGVPALMPVGTKTVQVVVKTERTK